MKSSKWFVLGMSLFVLCGNAWADSASTDAPNSTVNVDLGSAADGQGEGGYFKANVTSTGNDSSYTAAKAKIGFINSNGTTNPYIDMYGYKALSDGFVSALAARDTVEPNGNAAEALGSVGFSKELLKGLHVALLGDWWSIDQGQGGKLTS